MVISEYIRSGINLCFLHASLKTAAHLATYTGTQNTISIGSEKEEEV